MAGNGFRAGAVFTWLLQKPFNKDNDFNIDVKVLGLAFELLLQQAIFPGDAPVKTPRKNCRHCPVLGEGGGTQVRLVYLSALFFDINTNIKRIEVQKNVEKILVDKGSSDQGKEIVHLKEKRFLFLYEFSK